MRAAVLDQEAAPELAAERERREVAERRGGPGDREHRDEVDAALRGHHAAEHDRRLTRRDEPDEGAGLEEGERADEQVGPGAERLGEVGEDLLEVRRRDEPGLHGREQPGRRDARAEQRRTVTAAREPCGREAHAA